MRVVVDYVTKQRGTPVRVLGFRHTVSSCCVLAGCDMCEVILWAHIIRPEVSFVLLFAAASHRFHWVVV